MSTPCRLVTQVGRNPYRGAWWGEGCPHGIDGGAGRIRHASRELGGDGHIDYFWVPTPCLYCGASFKGSMEWPHVSRHAGTEAVWSTEDGNLHPGDMRWQAHYLDRTECWPAGWTNCSGQHLHVMLPNRVDWDIDSRASNCTLPDDTTHRCWVRTGEPPKVTAGKAGSTCSAGAGSIRAGDYHGFLQDGVLT